MKLKKVTINYFLMGAIPGLFFLFSLSIQYRWLYTFNIIFCRWLDSNRGPMESEATTSLSTELHPLPDQLLQHDYMLYAETTKIYCNWMRLNGTQKPVLPVVDCLFWKQWWNQAMPFKRDFLLLNLSLRWIALKSNCCCCCCCVCGVANRRGPQAKDFFYLPLFGERKENCFDRIKNSYATYLL